MNTNTGQQGYKSSIMRELYSHNHILDNEHEDINLISYQVTPNHEAFYRSQALQAFAPVNQRILDIKIILSDFLFPILSSDFLFPLS